MERRPYRPLRALKTIVNGGVDHVHAGFNGGNDCIRVSLIGARVRLAQIGADADRGEPQAVLLAEVPRSGTAGKSRGVFLRAVGSRKRRHLTSHIGKRRLYVIVSRTTR